MGDQLAALIAAAAADALDPRLCRIVCLRFGVDGTEPQTLEAIGNQYGVTRERVRQLVAQAMKKLRTRSRVRLRSRREADPCAALVLYLEQSVRAGEPGDVERLREWMVSLPPQTRALARELIRKERLTGKLGG